MAAGVNVVCIRWPQLRLAMSCLPSCLQFVCVVHQLVSQRGSPSSRWVLVCLSGIHPARCTVSQHGGDSTVLQKEMNKNLSTFCWYINVISTQRYTKFVFSPARTVFSDRIGFVPLQSFMAGVPSIAAGIAACSCSKWDQVGQ